MPSLPDINVTNATTITVSIAVNGTVVKTLAPGTGEYPIHAALPALPWVVEARSPSGRVLVSMNVSTFDLLSSTSGRDALANLACGSLDLFTGPLPLGNHFSPDPSKPCD